MTIDAVFALYVVCLVVVDVIINVVWGVGRSIEEAI
jgi:hypothetical protein